MAEIVGVTSSALAFGETVIKTRNFLKEASQLPDQIQDLLDLIQAYQLLNYHVLEIESQDNCSNVDLSLRNTSLADLIRRSHGTLESETKLLSEFLTRITTSGKLKSKYLTLKFVFNGKISHSKERVYSTAQKLLPCAILYSAILLDNGRIQATASNAQDSTPAYINMPAFSTQQKIGHIQKSHVHHSEPNSTNTANIKSVLAYQGTQRPNQSWDGSRVLFKIYFPKWLWTTGWEVSLCDNWNSLSLLNFRSYSILSSDSEIFLVVQRGDLSGMLHLFEVHNAHPWDRDEQGLSLLHHAIYSNEPSICKELLRCGLRNCIDEVINEHFTPRQLSLWNLLSQNVGSSKHSSSEQLVEMFESYSNDSVHYNSDQFFWLGLFCGTTDVTILSRFQQKVAPLFFQKAAYEKLYAARFYVMQSQVGHHPNPDVMMFLLGRTQCHELGEMLDSREARLCLLHTVAIGFARARRDHRPSTIVNGPNDDGARKRWDDISCTLIRSLTADDIHCVEQIRIEHPIYADARILLSEWTGTPLVSILRGALLEEFPTRTVTNDVEIYGFQIWQESLSFVATRWLTQVSQCGVNLLRYGQREKQIIAHGKSIKPDCCDFTMVTGHWSKMRQTEVKESLPVCLLGFEYGATVSEWIFHWQVDAMKLVGEFWQTVNSNIQCTHVPGAWVD